VTEEPGSAAKASVFKGLVAVCRVFIASSVVRRPVADRQISVRPYIDLSQPLETCPRTSESRNGGFVARETGAQTPTMFRSVSLAVSLVM
jgi:hypothetical protein